LRASRPSSPPHRGATRRAADSSAFNCHGGKNGGSISDASERAEKAGVGLYTADPFYAKPPDRTAILFGYAALRERDIREGIRRLAAAL
jgi:DNA-binding transcriptional MocR family regulator